MPQKGEYLAKTNTNRQNCLNRCYSKKKIEGDVYDGKSKQTNAHT